MSDAKPCSRCRLLKPLADFGRDRSQSCGYKSQCKACAKESAKAWPSSDPEKRKAVHARYYAKNRDERVAGSKAWREQNVEHRQAYNRLWYQANREKLTDYSRAYRAANQESVADGFRRWYESNKGIVRAIAYRRRAREAGAEGYATAVQIEARVTYYGGRCWMCGAPWQEIDHVKPLAKGGSNWPSNLRPACAPCNRGKRDNWPVQIIGARKRAS